MPLRLAALLAVGLCCCSHPSQFKRDFAAAPALLSLPAVDDLFAVSDPHGDHARLSALLKVAGLSDGAMDPSKARWTGGGATLVCKGDLIDKGSEGLQVIALLRALQVGAPATGGRVVVTMGNHEAEFLADASASKVSDFARELKGAGIDPVAVGAGAAEPGPFLGNLPFGVRVGDWFFAHGGDPQDLGFEALDAFLRGDVEAHGFGAQALSAETSLLEARLGGSNWWDRYGKDPDQVLQRLTAQLGVRHLVQGHQPVKVTFPDGAVRQRGVLFEKYGGKLVLLDVGMSRAVDDSSGALLHVHRAGGKTVATVIHADGTGSPLWSD